MSLYPLFANLKGRTTLVVGGGVVAARKVDALLEADARVRVAAPRLTASLQRQARDGRIERIEGAFRPAWLEDAWLVIAATSDRELNARVARAAEARRIFVNVVDDTEHSLFHAPARLRRGAMTVAISSAGRAPALAGRLRADLETALDGAIGALAELVARHRERIRKAFPDAGARRRYHDRLLDGPVGTALRQGRPVEAERALLRQLTAPASTPGSVALVGAGPGDPDLLTIKAQRALQQADIILHDRLVTTAVLDRARRDALRVDVGKRHGEDPHATQLRIHRLLREHAGAGRRVVRLHGGDPLLFGRGGEELEFLREHGIACEVVPGITAAIAAAADAGIPLTRRQQASALHITTGHRLHQFRESDWNTWARSRQTLALYMAVARLGDLPAKLIAHGRAADTPFALVENASRPEQRVLTGTLTELATLAERHHIQAPALLLIGEVAAACEATRCIRRDEPLAPAA